MLNINSDLIFLQIGKTTLANAIVNHFYGVEWEDPFRLVLIPDNQHEGQSQSHSQTSWITAYTLPWQQGCRASYHLTIVDTPGFGDTKGLWGDKSITSQLQKFFSERQPKGLDHLDGIGIVLQASAGRLTPTEKYIFDSVLSVFGKDVIKNIYLMITFADNNRPPVLEAVKEGNIPHVNFFCLNNSAIFAPNEDTAAEAENKINAIIWKLGRKNIQNFFTELQLSKSVSLQMSEKVLRERDALEAIIHGIQNRIDDGKFISFVKPIEEDDGLKFF